MKKIIPNSIQKKALLNEREQKIIDSFGKTYNTIKRTTEEELNEASITPDGRIADMQGDHISDDLGNFIDAFDQGEAFDTTEMRSTREEAYRINPEAAEIADFAVQNQRKLRILYKEYIADGGGRLDYPSFTRAVFDGNQDLVTNPDEIKPTPLGRPIDPNVINLNEKGYKINKDNYFVATDARYDSSGDGGVDIDPKAHLVQDLSDAKHAEYQDKGWELHGIYSLEDATRISNDFNKRYMDALHAEENSYMGDDMDIDLSETPEYLKTAKEKISKVFSRPEPKPVDMGKSRYSDIRDSRPQERRGNPPMREEDGIDSFPVNKDYTHFAVSKETGKIATGWETVSDIESLKYYAKGDLEDMDLKPSSFRIISAKVLIRRGIDPYNWDNWRKNGDEDGYIDETSQGL